MFPFEFDGVSILFVWLSLVAYVFVPLLQFDCVSFLLSLMMYIRDLSS